MSPFPSFSVTMGPLSWTYPAKLVCAKRFDALRFEGLILQLRGDSTLWKSVEKPCHFFYSESSSYPDIHGHHRSSCVRHSIGHLKLLSRLLFHRVSTLSHGKCTFIFGSLNFPTFLQVYFMYHETLGRKLKKYLAKATRSLLGRLVNLPVKKLKFLLYLPPPFSLDKEMSRLTRRNRKIK